MDIGSKALAFWSSALMAALLSACLHQESKNVAASADSAMLLDKEATPAAGGLVRLQEGPAFPVDDKERPFAVINDGDHRAPAGDKPISIQESRPKQ